MKSKSKRTDFGGWQAILWCLEEAPDVWSKGREVPIAWYRASPASLRIGVGIKWSFGVLALSASAHETLNIYPLSNIICRRISCLLISSHGRLVEYRTGKLTGPRWVRHCNWLYLDFEISSASLSSYR